jgi:hypothetical protein
MSTGEPPSDKETEQDPADQNDDHSVVTPPTYPAYSTPPPEGLATNEDG